MTDDPATCPEADAGFTALYLTHARRVFGFALAGCQGDKHEAEEIVQNTFLDVLRGYRKYFAGQRGEVQEARVMDMAKKRIVDRFRYHRSRKVDPFDNVEELLPPASDPLVRVEHRDTMDGLWQVISEDLTPTEHRVAFMTWAMDSHDTHIAQVLGIPSEATVRSHRSRALAKIRHRLGDRIDLSGEERP